MPLNTRLLKRIYTPNVYSDHVNDLTSMDIDTVNATFTHAQVWCNTNAEQLSHIYKSLSPMERQHPFIPRELTPIEWALATYFIWECNTMRQAIEDAKIAEEINLMLTQS